MHMLLALECQRPLAPKLSMTLIPGDQSSLFNCFTAISAPITSISANWIFTAFSTTEPVGCFYTDGELKKNDKLKVLKYLLKSLVRESGTFYYFTKRMSYFS